MLHLQRAMPAEGNACGRQCLQKAKSSALGKQCLNKAYPAYMFFRFIQAICSKKKSVQTSNHWPAIGQRLANHWPAILANHWPRQVENHFWHVRYRCNLFNLSVFVLSYWIVLFLRAFHAWFCTWISQSAFPKTVFQKWFSEKRFWTCQKKRQCLCKAMPVEGNAIMIMAMGSPHLVAHSWLKAVG